MISISVSLASSVEVDSLNVTQTEYELFMGVLCTSNVTVVDLLHVFEAENPNLVFVFTI